MMVRKRLQENFRFRPLKKSIDICCQFIDICCQLNFRGCQFFDRGWKNVDFMRKIECVDRFFFVVKNYIAFREIVDIIVSFERNSK